MTCHRCGGVMLVEQYDDPHDYTEQAEFTGWRCVNCGAVLDPVIAVNGRSNIDKAVPSQPATARTMGVAVA